MPTASQVVIADERGGPRLTVDLGRRWVSALQMLHGPGGRAEPQLAIKSCAEPAESSCQDELLTLTPQAPLTVTKRISGEEATAAVAGRLDRGRRVQRPPNARGKCAVALTVREPDGSTRTLPRLPARAREYRRCKGLEHEQIAGDHVYAWIRRAAPGHDFEATFVYAFDLAAGPSARWHERYRPYRYTPGSYGWALGPGTTDRGQYWLETDTEFEHPRNACDIAATDTAVYRLDNPRCTVFYGEGTRGAIRRISDATFVPATP
jgi:hypothetical protein